MTTLIPKYSLKNGSAIPTGAVNRAINIKLFESVSILDFGADSTGVEDSTTAIQNAINFSDRVYFPIGTYKVTSTITLKQFSYLYGDGIGSTNINSTATGFTFELLNPNGLDEIESPKFFDLSITTTGSGIRLNSQSNGFTDDASSQQFMVRPVIERCAIVGSGTGTGVQWSKCFNGYISNNLIEYFSYAIDFKGCDINEITNNRLAYCSAITLRVVSVGTFGSQTLVLHNDILSPTTGATTFVEASDRNFLLRDNYFENVSTVLNSVVNITGGFYVKIDGNRVEVTSAYATNWLVVSVALTSLWVCNNVNNGPLWGNALFNSGNGALYFYNTLYRQNIFHQNNATEAGFPFCTMSQDSVNYAKTNTPWLMTPSTDGLIYADQSPLVYVKNNNYVLYAGMGYSNWKPTTGLTGTFNVYIYAYGTVNAQKIQCQWGNGYFTPLSGNVTVTLGTSPTRYLVFSSIAPTDLFLRFGNVDAGNTADILIEQVVVEYA